MLDEVTITVRVPRQIAVCIEGAVNALTKQVIETGVDELHNCMVLVVAQPEQSERYNACLALFEGGCGCKTGKMSAVGMGAGVLAAKAATIAAADPANTAALHTIYNTQCAKVYQYAIDNEERVAAQGREIMAMSRLHPHKPE